MSNLKVGDKLYDYSLKEYTVAKIGRQYAHLEGRLIREWSGGISELTKNGFKCGRNLYNAIAKDQATAYGFKWAYKE